MDGISELTYGDAQLNWWPSASDIAQIRICDCLAGRLP